MSYNVEDKVMAYDKGKVYPAKIIKVSEISSSRKYFIHFLKWARKYDAWFDESLLCFESEEDKLNLLKATGSTLPTAIIVKKNDKSKNKVSSSEMLIEEIGKIECKVKVIEGMPIEEKKRKSIPKNEESGESFSKKRFKELSEKELIDEDDDINVNYNNVSIPFEIKKHLVDEWSLISSEQKRLLKLPRPLPVKQVLSEFLESKYNTDPADYPFYLELFNGFQSHFEKALPLLLLYRQERVQVSLSSTLLHTPLNVMPTVAQYDQLMDIYKDKPPSFIYGCEHLMRFYVRLPKLLGNVFMPTEELEVILSRLTELLKYIHKNREKYLTMADYVFIDEAMQYSIDNKESFMNSMENLEIFSPKVKTVNKRRK